MTTVIGVLALQGDVREHLRMLAACGAPGVAVRRAGELDEVAALVIPGGESTTMSKLAAAFELLEPLRKRVAGGMPAFGSCAGMIMLADRVVDGVPGQETIGGLDVEVRRNAFGRQVESFEEDIHLAGLPGGPVRAVFIRAPWVQEIGPAATALGRVNPGTVDEHVVVVRQGNLLATSFHPELTGDLRIHAYFCDQVVRGS